MLFERKLTERELDSREAVIQGLLGNKRNLVKKYGKDGSSSGAILGDILGKVFSSKKTNPKKKEMI